MKELPIVALYFQGELLMLIDKKALCFDKSLN